MIILDGPYVSDLMKKHLAKSQLAIVKTDYAGNELRNYSEINFVDEREAIEQLKNEDYPSLYTNSENAIDWVQKHLPKNQISKWLQLFKDKAAFRRLNQKIFPQYFFKEIAYDELLGFDATTLPYPCILKPNVGFFSLGVYTLNKPADWPVVVGKIADEIDNLRTLYPQKVLDVSAFIVEEVIKGDEFAFDAYFDNSGNPVILGIYKHYFASPDDVSDRVYITSKQIIDKYLKPFTQYLRQLSELVPLRNFPLHTEVRVDDSEKIMPIEVNPMRYGGWCTTADMVYLGLGYSPYQFYLESKKPDWEKIWAEFQNDLFSVIVLDNSTGVQGSAIDSFDYDAVKQQFEHVLEIREADFSRFPLFGFVFTRTQKDNFAELDAILQSDLRAYIKLKQKVINQSSS